MNRSPSSRRLAELLPGWRAAPATGEPEPNPTNAAVVFMLAVGGDLDDAATRLDRVAGNAFADVADDAGWHMTIALLTEAAARVADRGAASALAEILGPFAADGTNFMTGGINLGPATRLLALVESVLDRHDAAAVNFARAVESADRFGSPIWSARTRLDWAGHLRVRGQADRADARINEAAATMGDLDLPALRRQLSELRA